MEITCRLCQSKAPKTHTSVLLGKYSVNYFLCPTCDLLQTETPYWLEEAYQSSISILDTGLIHRNQMTAGRVAKFCFEHGLDKTQGMDFAGGYGILVRMLRDRGLDFFWADKYGSNLVARGFEANPELKYDLITAFEVLEHFNEPHIQLGEILDQWAPKFFLFETTLRPKRSVPPTSWKYYAHETGQHIAFYSTVTCEYIAQRFSYHFSTRNRLLIFSKERISTPWNLWAKMPFIWQKTFLPDSIPFISRDREKLEEKLRFQFQSMERKKD